MKYIMIEVAAHGELPARRVPVIFPDVLTHLDMARALEPVVKTTLVPAKYRAKTPVKTTSAGICRLDDAICHGKSESLDLESRGHADSRVIEMYDYLHGIG